MDSSNVQTQSPQLPLEIWHAVAEYLPVPDLKTFSLCSKFWRQVTFPILFKSIKLYKTTVEEFRSGSLRGLEPIVRHITLAELIRPLVLASSWDPSWYETTVWPPGNHYGQIDIMIEIIELADTLSAALASFPALTSLYIPFNASKDYEWILLAAIFRRIGEYPFFKNLKRLSVNCTLIPYPYNDMTTEVAERLGPSHKYTKFLEGLELKITDTAGLLTGIPFPPALEEAGSSYFGGWNLVEGAVGTLRPFKMFMHAPPTAQNPMFPYLFFFNSEATLKKLTLKAQHFEATGLDLTKPMLPNLQDLWFISYIAFGDFTEKNICRAFPNLRSLRVDAPYYTTGYKRPPYEYITDMLFLERVRVPMLNSRSKINVVHDCKSVMKLREQTGVQRFEYLELYYKGFVSGNEVYSPDGPKPDLGGQIMICSIQGGKRECEWFIENGGVRSRHAVGEITGDVERRYKNFRWD
ncbi:hypothetical protein TWF694_005345 [Orbilia ellipsospora]|uniref:F-box domain-containing protein n=1 Tax=Orbilia ellipsospora TaxID=2528407 RepID=A0AAV9WV06_9PEZI